jgi:hypothetical protein
MMVWLVALTILAPALLVVGSTAEPVRARLPLERLSGEEELLIFFEIMRPVALPIGVALAFGLVLICAWWILWRAGLVVWWLNPDTDELRLVPVLAAGLVSWWRWARLALITALLMALAVVLPWLPLRLEVEERLLLPLLVLGSVLSIVTTILAWLGGLRGAWMLGETGRRSAFVAWARGAWTSLRQPFRSLIPLLVWAVPGLALLVLPLIYDGPAAMLFLVVAWLLSTFCWVALHLSYAPPKPAPPRPVSPLEPPTAPYVTTRFPTLHRDD